MKGKNQLQSILRNNYFLLFINNQNIDKQSKNSLYMFIHIYLFFINIIILYVKSKEYIRVI